VSGNDLLSLHKKEDLVMMYDVDFDIAWDENDMVRTPEDDWISSVLGDETEVIDELINGN